MDKEKPKYLVIALNDYSVSNWHTLQDISVYYRRCVIAYGASWVAVRARDNSGVRSLHIDEYAMLQRAAFGYKSWHEPYNL